MANRDMVVIGASSGGIDALKALVAPLPEDLDATLLIVLHTPPQSPNNLDRILARAGPLPAGNARDWERLEPGRIYIAPSDHHLTVDRTGHARVTRGPRENRFRPAVDVLFRSAALAFGPRVVGVVLSGSLDDGTAGLRSIKERGGVAIVQDPREAAEDSMPRSAVEHVAVDHVATAKGIAQLIDALSHTPADDRGAPPVSRLLDAKVRIAQEANALASGFMAHAHPSVFACPECHGVLMAIREGNDVRFRCHTGHAYSSEALNDELHEKSEATLWSAMRSLEETIMLLQRMADTLDANRQPDVAARFRARADEARRRADRVRGTLIPAGEKPPEYPAAAR